MRIIKLSPEEFSTPTEVEDFFTGYLDSDDRYGRFRIKAGRLEAGALQPTERLVFSHLDYVRYIARAASDRMENQDELSEEYPYFFLIDVETLHPVSQLSWDNVRAVVDDPEVGRGEAWEKIPEDSPLAQQIWDLLMDNIL